MSEPNPPDPIEPKKNKPRLTTWDKLPPADQPPAGSQAIDWDARAGTERGLLRRVEQLALLFKEPINRLVGTSQLNPLYYSDTIAFFMLVVVVITGIYVLMFYQYGYDVSYISVESMERFIISRAARAIHRYASGGLMIFGMLHAIRMFFMDRFRGPRWLGWVAGVVSVAWLWLAGITGYWLPWDQGAQLITDGFVNLLNTVPALATGFYFQFVDASVANQNGWLLMLLLVVIHVGLTVIAGVFYWLHIKRLQRPRFFPPRYWIIGMSALLVIAGVAFPAGMLPPANFNIIPGTTPLDPIFLFYLPPSLRSVSAAVWISLIVLAVTTLVTVIPWLFPRPKLKPVTITAERCTGCTHCVLDCPYNALSMVPRHDNTPFTELAVVDPKLCVSCGICIGSCDTMAISLGDNQPELLWQDIAGRLDIAKNANRPVKLIFTCERHAAHNTHTYAKSIKPVRAEDAQAEIVPVTCVAMVNPGLMTHALDAGAAEVQVVGCPPNDCTNREGNMWTAERLERMRAPKLKPRFKDAPIFTTWLAPDHFSDALPIHRAENKADEQHAPTSLSQVMAMFSRRNLIVAAIILAVGLLLQVRFTYTPFTPYQNAQAGINVAVRQAAAAPVELTVDGAPVLTANSADVLQPVAVTTGEHQIRLTAAGQPLFDQTITIDQGTVLHLAFDQTKHK